MSRQLNKRKYKFQLLSKKNATSKIRHAEFVALIYIRNTNIALDNDLQEILQILKKLQTLNKKSRLIFKTNCTLSQHILWEALINEINDNLNHIKQQVDYIKENTIKINHFNHYIFWQQNEVFLNSVKTYYKKIEELGHKILSAETKVIWKTNVGNSQDEFLSTMIPLLNICKIELNFIKMHTPDNLKTIMQDVVNTIPKIRNKKRSHRYERAYITALEKYKKEFSEKRSFWDILLKVLTIDMKKPPSEYIMLGRWIDGKNKNKINSIQSDQH